MFLKILITFCEIEEVLSSQTNPFAKSQKLFFPTLLYYKCQIWRIQKKKVKNKIENMKWEHDLINIYPLFLLIYQTQHILKIMEKKKKSN